MKQIEAIDKNEIILLDVASRLGWCVIHSDHLGIQLERQKRYSYWLLISGAVLSVILIGILILIIGFADYLAQRSEYLYIPRIRLTEEKLEEVIKQLE